MVISREVMCMDVNVEPCKVPCNIRPPVPWPDFDTPGEGPYYDKSNTDFVEWSDNHDVAESVSPL